MIKNDVMVNEEMDPKLLIQVTRISSFILIQVTSISSFMNANVNTLLGFDFNRLMFYC